MGTIDDILAGQQNDKLANVTGEQALEHMVGENAKYKTVEDLAKAALSGQLHISDLENENKVFRDNQDKSKGIDDILAALNGNKDKDEDHGNHQDDDNHQKGGEEQISIADQIAAAFKSRDDKTDASTAAANQAQVAADIAKAFGDNAGKMFDKVGKELGIDLNELAKKSPQAVLKLVADARPASNTTDFNSTVNQEHSHNDNTRESIAAQYKAGTIDRYQKITLENEALTRLGDKYFE